MGGSADDLIPDADAGWDQCWSWDPPSAADLAKTPVLPNGATITITLGLHTASFHSTS
jgi:hypothetical protein